MKRFIAFFLILIVIAIPIWASNTEEDLPRDHYGKLTPVDVDTNTDTLSGSSLADSPYFSDSAYAVDDDIWRQLRQARDYFAMGVAANQEASWEEAQFYLERALQVMAGLDIDEDKDGPEATRYEALLNEIVADYRLTLLSLGTMPEDASPSAFLEKFSTLSVKDETPVKLEGEAKEVAYDVPIVYNEKVKKSIIYFQTVAREAFEKYLERSGRYLPIMADIFEQYGLPKDIAYLPLIESGFNCRAFSWARAMGPWQFIASTGRLYDLDRNWWFDERRDFIKSTHAAARFLRDLYDRFGSWELALAAYNGGPGRISRQIKRQNTDNFWDLNLRKQTMDYVPFYMAATIIAKNPELYGFHIDYDDPVSYDVVTLDRCLDLKTVAKACNSSLEELQELNPELLRNVTPPQTDNYKLRIPKGTSDLFLTELPKLRSPQETSWVRHQIARGETISSIASKYGISQYAIFQANNLNRHSKIYAGKSLIIPVPLDGSRNNYSAPEHRIATGDNTYVVQKGDNLWDISRSFGTSPDELRKLNYLGNSSRIYVGQVLKLPGSAQKASAPVRYDPDDQPAGNTVTYIVKKGDTVWDIARAYGTTTATIRRLNGLSRSGSIYIGQKLLVTDNGGNGGSFLYYTVKKGDTLYDIARAFGTSINSLKSLNGISNINRLRVGTRLKIARN